MCGYTNTHTYILIHIKCGAESNEPSVDNLKPAMVGVYAVQKLANIKNQGLVELFIF